MGDFVRSLSQAASSPYAFASYGILLIAFLLVGVRLRMAKLLLDRIESLPEKDRRGVFEMATGTVLPATISPAQWLRHTRLRGIMLLVGATIIAVVVIATIALLRPASMDEAKLRRDIRMSELAALKPLYPLEPIELEYDVEIPMADSRLAPAARLWEQAIREDPNLQSLSEVEDRLKATGRYNDTEFQSLNLECRRLDFVGDDQSYVAIWVSSIPYVAHEAKFEETGEEVSATKTGEPPWKGQPDSLEQQVKADFSARLFRKSVRVSGKLRDGYGVPAKSALDLIGRRVYSHCPCTAPPAESPGDDRMGHVTWLRMRFPYDERNYHDFGQREEGGERIVQFAGDEHPMITAAHIGVRGVVSER